MTGIAYFSTGHEQTQYNRVCYFHSFGAFLAPKGSSYSELIKYITSIICVKFLFSIIFPTIQSNRLENRIDVCPELE